MQLDFRASGNPLIVKDSLAKKIANFEDQGLPADETICAQAIASALDNYLAYLGVLHVSVALTLNVTYARPAAVPNRAGDAK